MNAWLIGAAVIIALVVAGFGLLKLKASGEWDSVTGVVLDSAIEKIYHAPSQRNMAGDNVVDYKINIRYRYSVNGRELTGETVTAGMPNIAGSKQDAEDIVRRYPAGETIRVFYNPVKPSEAALITGRDVPIAGFVVFGLLIAGVAGLILFLLNSKLFSD